ncbi:MAG: hypothetical protein ACR2P5_05350 [Gammaproteobacteria bacterium]
MTPTQLRNLQVLDALAQGFRRSSNLSAKLSAPWNAGIGVSQPQSVVDNAYKGQEFLRQQRQQGARASLMGGYDPQSGITWNQGRGIPSGVVRDAETGVRGLMDDPTRASLMGSALQQRQSDLAQAFPAQYGAASVKSLFPGKPTERDKLRNDLRTMGYTDTQIRDFMVNRDRYQFTTDMFGNRTVFDRYAGSPVGGAKPSASPPPETDVPTLPGGFESGTGGSGFFGNIANTITDALGAGLAAPQTQRAKTALDTLKTRTMLQMTVAIPGRPSNLIRERLENLAVEPASLFTGDERGLDRLTQTKGLITEEISRLDNMLASPGGYKPDDLAKARDNKSQLEGLLASYDHIIDNWRAGSAGPQKIDSKEVYDNLPSGTQFVAPDGSVRVKP